MRPETDQEARIRRWKYASRDFEKAQERERQERRARGIRARAIMENLYLERPDLRSRTPVATPTRAATVNRKAGSAPWAVREMFSDGRAEWYRVDGSESGARDLADRLRKTSNGKVEVLRMGGPQGGRTTR